MTDSILPNPQIVTPQKRNRPQLVTTVAPRTRAFAEWVRCQHDLKNEGHALDWIVDGILAGRRFDTSEFTDDSGQVSQEFATFLTLIVGFIGIGSAAVVVSAAYIQPALRALGIN